MTTDNIRDCARLIADKLSVAGSAYHPKFTRDHAAQEAVALMNILGAAATTCDAGTSEAIHRLISETGTSPSPDRDWIDFAVHFA